MWFEDINGTKIFIHEDDILLTTDETEDGGTVYLVLDQTPLAAHHVVSEKEYNIILQMMRKEVD